MPLKRVFLSPYTRIYIELADPMKQLLDNKIHFNYFQCLLTKQNKKTKCIKIVSQNSKRSKNIIKSQALLVINSLSQQANLGCLYSTSCLHIFFIKSLKPEQKTKSLRV